MPLLFIIGKHFLSLCSSDTQNKYMTALDYLEDD